MHAGGRLTCLLSQRSAPRICSPISMQSHASAPCAFFFLVQFTIGAHSTHAILAKISSECRERGCRVIGLEMDVPYYVGERTHLPLTIRSVPVCGAHVCVCVRACVRACACIQQVRTHRQSNKHRHRHRHTQRPWRIQQICTHARTHTHTRMHIHTRARAHTHTPWCTKQIRTYTHAHTCTHTPSSLSDTHTHTHTHTHTLSHTHSHMHTHTPWVHSANSHT